MLIFNAICNAIYLTNQFFECHVLALNVHSLADSQPYILFCVHFDEQLNNKWLSSTCSKYIKFRSDDVVSFGKMLICPEICAHFDLYLLFCHFGKPVPFFGRIFHLHLFHLFWISSTCTYFQLMYFY